MEIMSLINVIYDPFIYRYRKKQPIKTEIKLIQHISEYKEEISDVSFL